MEYLVWLYLATRLDAIGLFFGWMTAVSIIVTLISLGIIAFSDDDSTWDYAIRKDPEKLSVEKAQLRVKVRPWRNWGITLAVLSALMCALTPSKKDAMFIAGGVGVIEASKAVAGSVIAKHSVAIVEEWLARELSEQKQKSRDGRRRDEEPAEKAEKK